MSGALTELAAVWPPDAAMAKKAGHKPVSPMKAIREKCLDCCCAQPSEVRACEAVKCAFWPFRSGSHPYTAAKMEKPPLEADFKENGPASAATDPDHGSITSLERKKS